MIYAITNVSEVEALSEENRTWFFNHVEEESLDTVRKSNDGTQMVVKWKTGSNPCAALGLTFTIYDYEEIKAKMLEAEWISTNGA